MQGKMIKWDVNFKIKPITIDEEKEEEVRKKWCRGIEDAFYNKWEWQDWMQFSGEWQGDLKEIKREKIIKKRKEKDYVDKIKLQDYRRDAPYNAQWTISKSPQSYYQRIKGNDEYKE